MLRIFIVNIVYSHWQKVWKTQKSWDEKTATNQPKKSTLAPGVFLTKHFFLSLSIYCSSFLPCQAGVVITCAQLHVLPCSTHSACVKESLSSLLLTVAKYSMEWLQSSSYCFHSEEGGIHSPGASFQTHFHTLESFLRKSINAWLTLSFKGSKVARFLNFPEFWYKAELRLFQKHRFVVFTVTKDLRIARLQGHCSPLAWPLPPLVQFSQPLTGLE